MVDTMADWWESHAGKLAAIIAGLQDLVLKSLDGLISEVKGMFSNTCLEITLLLFVNHVNICCQTFRAHPYSAKHL
jgi:hypothetical protein